MNKINPLYLVIFFMLVALLMIVSSRGVEQNIVRVAQESAVLEVEGKYISGLREQWKDAKKSKKRVERILSMPLFSPHIVSKNLSKGVYSMQLENLDVHAVDSFVNKMLSQSVEIKRLQIDRINDKNATVVMEFRI